MKSSKALGGKMREQDVANELKILALESINHAGSGHSGSVLSCGDILYTLYTRHLLSSNVENRLRDRFVLSNGHACAILYAILAGFNYFDINEMKKYYEENPLEDREETLLNFQVLELLKAFDVNQNLKLLDYAKFILEKISVFSDMSDVVRVNFLQTEKRLRNLNEGEISELIEIRNRHNENKFFNISTNLLIGNLLEAKIIYNSLSEDEKSAFGEYPISKF